MERMENILEKNLLPSAHNSKVLPITCDSTFRSFHNIILCFILYLLQILIDLS
jgi:hypothetical protein